LTIALAATMLVAGVACSESDEEAQPPVDTAPVLVGTIDLSLDDPATCEHFDAGGCLLPFPSDHFTEVDATSATGLRLALAESAMPVNVGGTPIDPTEWNRSDGFSPGSLFVLVVPGVDLEASALPGVADIEASLADESSLVLLDTVTGERVPAWAELDQALLAKEPPADLAPNERALLLRPATNLIEGHRHVVALRGLVADDSAPIEASAGFRAYRDRLETTVPEVEARRGAMEQVFADLDAAGVGRDDLFLVWDVMVVSTEGLTGRLLAMRDDAFDSLGESGVPTFTVLEGEPTASDGGATPPPTRTISGTFDVPLFLTGDGGPGSVLNNGDDPAGIPVAAGTYTADFLCVVPTAPAEPGRSTVYGHGLLGSAREVLGLGTAGAAEADMTACATDWIGMSSADIVAIAGMIGDFSGFRALPDRLLQAHLNMLFLARLLDDPDGFASHPAFRSADGEPLFAPDAVGFLGASQGGILGGTTVAVAADFDRAVLAVPAQNYSTLLDRSIDFDEFDLVLAAAYPSAADRQVILSLIQILWDRAENNGYAQHLTSNPLPGSAPDKQVLILAAFGDHQVTNVGTDSLARTAGIPTRRPSLAAGRSSDVEPLWGIDDIGSWPHTGSAYLLWDLGTPTPPVTNTPPREGSDPHGAIGLVPEVRRAAAEFLATGRLDDPCPANDPCEADVG